MRQSSTLLFVFLMLLVVVSINGQSLSTEVYNSEDDLYEAFLIGDLSFEEYSSLRELIRQGIKVQNYFLFDEIPNLLFLNSQGDSSLTRLQHEQQAGFVDNSNIKTKSSLKFKYRYFRGLAEDDPSGYRLGTKFELNQHWQGAAKIQREYSGRERFISRSIEYNNSNNWLQHVALGSFNTRLGLGTIYGRRGNLFDYSERINNESILYPDYGGFNGINGKFKSGRVRGELLGVINRDSLYRLSSIGGMFDYSFDSWNTGIIYGSSLLEKRFSDSSLHDRKIGLNLENISQAGSIEMELTRQFGDGGESGALVIEGKRLFEDAQIKFAGWAYGDSFVNLTSGSKSASMSQTITDSLTEFKYSDRLSGQRGGLLRTKLKLHNDWELTSGVIVGQRKSDNSKIEFMGSLRRSWSKGFAVRADFLSRRTQSGPGSASVSSTERSRVELRLNLRNIKGRTYISYTNNSTGLDYWSWFGRASTYLKGFGELELWTNVGRITHNGIQYWYSYLKQMQNLSENTKLVMKLSHSYNRTREKQNQSTLSLEIETAL